MAFGPTRQPAVDVGDALSEATENAIHVQIVDGRIGIKAMILNRAGVEDLVNQLRALEPFLKAPR